MVWFRVDDKFHRGKKVRRLGSEQVTAMARVAAVGLWTLCGDWSADELMDGFVPWAEVERWDPERSLARRLIDVCLCHEAEFDGEPGIQFHDWSDWNPTRADVERRRAEQAERVRRWREKHGYAKSGDASGNALHDASPGPSPDRVEPGNALHDASPGIPPNPNPNPNPKGEGYVGSSGAETLVDTSASTEKPRLRRGARIPDDFLVTAEMVEWAREHAPHVDGRKETEKFVDYWRAKSGRDATKLDWVLTWRNWMRNTEERAPRAQRRSDDWDALKDE